MSPKETRAYTWPLAMKVADLPSVIKGHNPVHLILPHSYGGEQILVSRQRDPQGLDLINVVGLHNKLVPYESI